MTIYGSRIDADDPTMSYMFQAWARQVEDSRSRSSSIVLTSIFEIPHFSGICFQLKNNRHLMAFESMSKHHFHIFSHLLLTDS